ncbi:MAG TPA: hypothetical protein VGK73_25010 [Polyangiaceae bacterium]
MQARCDVLFDEGTAAGGAPEPGGDPEVGGAAGASPDGSSEAREASEYDAVSDEYAGDVTIAVHERVRTVLEVEWTQQLAAERSWLEFSFEGETLRSRPRVPELGPQRDVVLGVPAETEVSVRVVSEVGGVVTASSEYRATTGALPAGLPKPTLFASDPGRASPEHFMLGSVEDSRGGKEGGYYFRTFYLYLMDRKGRIVWYYADPSTSATSSFQRVARDGEYLWIEKRAYAGGLAESVVKMTLDQRYFEEIPVPGLSDCIDVTDDGALLYDVDGELFERSASGTTRSIWSCRARFGRAFRCYTNTVNWYSGEDTVLMSFPYENTVVEISRQTGALVGQYGSARGSYAFAPPLEAPPAAWALSFQHFPNRTPEGTLLVSTHAPGCAHEPVPGPYRHGFVEFDIDRATRTLTERFRYTKGPEWPSAKGMAIRVSNGNTLVNYGTGGVIREVTPEGRTVFGVKFDVPEGNDFFNKMVGHNVLLDDLYALNGGPG